jgi:hypothetical protein
MITGTIGLDTVTETFEALRQSGTHAKVPIEPGL